MVKGILKFLPEKPTIKQIKGILDYDTRKLLHLPEEQKEVAKKIFQEFEENKLSPEQRRYFLHKII
jgi:hypothetical protein